MPLPLLQATYASVEEFAAVFTSEISKRGLLVRGAALPAGASPGSPIELQVTVAGGAPAQVPARVAAVVAGVGVAVMFDAVPPALAALGAAPVEDAAAEAPKGALTDRLKTMTTSEKMQLALSGTREERTALFRDNNKSLHMFVLKNPRIGLDEVQAAAKSPMVSPDALKMIAEHREWSMNPTVCAGLVRNPKTPLPLALKVLDRVPMSDLRALAKGGARDQVVNAARKKIVG